MYAINIVRLVIYPDVVALLTKTETIEYMRYRALTDFGGFLWWLLIKFGKTELQEEQTKEKWARNIIFLIILGLITAFFTIKIF